VFALGEACAAVTAAMLDQWRPEDSRLSLSLEACRRISWATLPGAAIVAIHSGLGRACLIRDGAGFRPLYYSFRNATLFFSTNLPQLRSAASETGINTDKIAEMLAFGHRSGGRTVWQGIDTVGPGRLIEFQSGQRLRQHQFWRPDALFEVSERRRLEACSVDAVLHEIRDALDEGLAPLQDRGRLAIPCGGGVDSSLLGAYLSRKQSPLGFYTVNKPDADRQESEWMESIAHRIGVPCVYVNVGRENFFEAYFDFLSLTEQPAIGPNLVAHRILRRRAFEQGERDFVSGELCDTVFGGLGSFYYLSRRFRLLHFLSSLPAGQRFWLKRALSGEKSLLLEIMQLARGEELGSIAAGDLERSEYMVEIAALAYPGQSHAQHLADVLTWMNLRLIPSALHGAFFEYDEQPGGTTWFPFAHRRMMRLGLHLPYHFKRSHGVNKWIWRRFAAPYIGEDVAFRKKYTFPAPIRAWFDKAVKLIPGGFLEDLFCARLEGLMNGLGPNDPSRWTLVNVELWGRLNCWKEDPAALLSRVL
jgi:asparagine synthase (glutamine-hydrolysing)